MELGVATGKYGYHEWKNVSASEMSGTVHRTCTGDIEMSGPFRHRSAVAFLAGIGLTVGLIALLGAGGGTRISTSSSPGCNAVWPGAGMNSRTGISRCPG